jgi:predicted aminopeptidase
VAVEQEGMRRWLDRYGSEQDRKTSALIVQRRTEFGNLIESYRDRLDAVYGLHLPPRETRARKQALFAELDKDYERLKQSWGGFSGFDRWFERKANNALLASISIYTRKVPAFQALLAREGGDLRRFYAEAKRIARLNKPERTAALERLMPKTASTGSTAH